MIQLNDPALKRALIEKHHFQEYFSLDLEECSVLLRCEAGETLCHSGEVYPEIQLLADGALIASSVSKSGKLHCELQYQSPNILGLTSALWNKPAINTIETLTPCLCLSLSVDLYGEALHQDTKFLNYACSYLAEHIRKNFIHYEQLPTRLAQFILREQKMVTSATTPDFALMCWKPVNGICCGRFVLSAIEVSWSTLAAAATGFWM